MGDYDKVARNGSYVLIPKVCARYYDPPRYGYSIKAPTVGYAGVTVNLGEYDIKPNQFQTVNDALIALDQGRWYTCHDIHNAAVSQNWTLYDHLVVKETETTDKIEQIALILANHPEARKEAASTAAAPGGKKDAALGGALAKWTGTYVKKGVAPAQQMAGFAAPMNVAGSAHAMPMDGPTGAGSPESVSPAQRETIKELLAVPVKSNSYFGLPPKPTGTPLPGQ